MQESDLSALVEYDLVVFVSEGGVLDDTVVPWGHRDHTLGTIYDSGGKIIEACHEKTSLLCFNTGSTHIGLYNN